ncbi:MAG: hypothetical protein NVSMB45_18410 [Ginsengibacter sp.]
MVFLKQYGHRVDVKINNEVVTSFLYPDSLEKPVLYPLSALDGTIVTRGFPLSPKPGEPIDHPHHVGAWFTYENVNGLDFWNNSYAIAAEKKKSYGWIKVTHVSTSNGEKGKLMYTANWQDYNKNVLMTENTTLLFFQSGNSFVIDRTTSLKAVKAIHFADAKDGLYGLRLAHELQIPSTEDQKFTDNKGNVTIVKAGTDNIPNGTYLTSEGKVGNEAWSTRGKWCVSYGKIGKDSVSVVIIDHPTNPNYPTFWHARGYGLFSANPLGESVFTNGKSSKNLELKIGESVTFKYRVVINAANQFLRPAAIESMSDEFAIE